MDASLPLVVEYRLSEDELVSFLAEGLSRSRLYRFLWSQRRFALGLCLIGGLMAASLALGMEWWRDAEARFIAAVLFGAFVFLLSAFDERVRSWFIRPRVRSGRYAQFLRPIRIEIGPARISATDRESGAAYAWASAQSIRAGRTGIVIHLQPSGALLVPRRAFDDNAAFVYFLNAADKLRRAKS